MKVQFHPTQPLSTICEAAASDIQAYRETLLRGQDELLRQLSGDRLQGMLNSRQFTIDCLSQADAGLRLVAAALVADYWPPHESFAEPCFRLAFSDTDPRIRGAAFKCLLYRLYPFVEEPTGMFMRFIESLRALEPRIPEDSVLKVRRELRNSREQVEERFRQSCERLCGEHLTEMERSFTVAQSFLGHEDPNLRRGALLVIHKCWRAVADMRAVCVPLITNDADLKVRIEAISVISLNEETDDPEIGFLLARILRDEAESPEVRRQAYRSLFNLRRMPVRRRLQCSSPSFKFPEDVDWSFVDSFLTGGADESS